MWTCVGDGTAGRREAGIFPAHVPVVSLSNPPASIGGKSKMKYYNMTLSTTSSLLNAVYTWSLPSFLSAHILNMVTSL